MASHLAASIAIPFPDLEQAMKRGKVLFTWKQLRLWMSPKPSNALTEHDAVSLELPLSVLTPLFLARRSGSASPRKLAAVQDIPDVFQVRKSEAAAPAPEPQQATTQDSGRSPLPEPVVIPFEQSAQISTPPRPVPTPLDKLTAARSSAGPTELVQRACQLSGVAGALLTTPDGLVIASQLPASLSAETAAAFLPQIYSRLGQYTRELKLGDPAQVEMLVGNIPLLIFRLANAFFAVLGKAAEPMPKLQLSALAAQLSARSN
jgi:predicted regulator of Ras-like GTPase activity (Roadblock/LC7/MglB family)